MNNNKNMFCVCVHSHVQYIRTSIVQCGSVCTAVQGVGEAKEQTLSSLSL